MWSGTCSKIKNSIQTTPTIDHLWNCFHILTGEKSKRCHWHVVGGMKRWNIKEGNKEFRFANDFIPLRGAWGRMFTSFYPSCSTTGVPETGKIWFHKFCWSWSPFCPDFLFASTSITIVRPPALILTCHWIWFKCLSTECIVKMKVKLCLLHFWEMCSRWKWRNKILHFGRLHVNGRPLCSNYPRSGPALFCIQKIPIIPKWRKYGKVILTIPALKMQEKYKMQKIYQ